MTYATLVVGRVKFRAVTITDGAGTRYASKESPEAQDLYDSKGDEAADQQHQKALEEHYKKLAAFDASVRIDTNVKELRDTGGLRKKEVVFDRVTVVPERALELEAGTGAGYIAKRRAESFPKPVRPQRQTFDTWFANEAELVRTWQAVFYTADQQTPLAVPEDSDYSWGFPIAFALGVLGRLAGEGWRLVHVSEDRGLYNGADAPDESYPTRVRYLLQH